MADYERERTNIEEEFLDRLQKESSTLTNINYILNKLDDDGHLTNIKKAFDLIFEGEISFITQKIFSKTKKEDKRKFKRHIKRNIFVLVKNLKIILNCMGGVNSRSDLEGEVL